MNIRLLALLCASAAGASAQLTDYLGPGILTRGAGSVGQRSGQDVELRFFANVSGIYDTGIQPISVDSSGELIQPGGLYGTEATIGVYGRHNFRRSVLGVDYSGNYRHYADNTYYNGSNHQLSFGYTHQKSQRLVFDTNLTAGTTNLGTNFSAQPQTNDTIIDPSFLLFDNRTYYLQGGMDTTYALNSRTSVVVGGSGYTVRRQSRALVGVDGYTLRGALQRRLNQETTVGVAYGRTHFNYTDTFGESDIDSFTGFFVRQFGRAWTLKVQGGAFIVETQGLQRVAVDPAISKILGITSVLETFYRQNVSPTGSVSLARQFRHATWSVDYSRSFSPGNGVYLTSRQENFGTGFSYTGVRRWSFSIVANRSRLESVGQDLSAYSGYFGNVNIGYAITPAINFTGNFGARYQDIGTDIFRRTSTRTSFGIAFSPGEIPLSFR